MQILFLTFVKVPDFDPIYIHYLLYFNKYKEFRVRKKLFLLFFSFFSILLYLDEYLTTPLPVDTITNPTKHNILLNLSSKIDKVIYNNLIYSNYNCFLLNPRQAQCTQFRKDESTIPSNDLVELYKHTFSNGQAFRIYQHSNGETNIEFRIKSSNTRYRYSFTSINQIPLFTKKKGLFVTDTIEWDISSLNHIL